MIKVNILMRLGALKNAREGYALPTVLVASLVLLIIGASGMQAIASTSRAINDQYWNTLAEQAKESGMKYVENCLRDSSDEKDPTRDWADSANTITQKTDCMGTSVEDNPDFLVENNASGNIPKWRTSFVVTAPVDDTSIDKRVSKVTGTVEILSASNIVVRTYTSQSTVILNITGAQLGVQVAKLAPSIAHTCALLTNGKSYCAGGNYNGNLGNGGSGVGANSDPTPMSPLPSGVTSIVDVVTQSFVPSVNSTGNSCILTNDQQVHCVGTNTVGQMAIGAGQTTAFWPTFRPGSPISSMRFALAGGLTSITSPVLYSFGVDINRQVVCTVASDNKVYCAGYNGNGRALATSSATELPTAYDFGLSGTGDQIATKIIPINNSQANSTGICVLTTVGKVYCRGNNYYGEFGIGTRNTVNNSSQTSSNPPVEAYTAVPGGTGANGTIVDFGSASRKTCALYSSGALYCAGSIPDDGAGFFSTPTRFGAGSETYRDFTLGPTSICGVTSSDVGKCASLNSYGELGNGGTSSARAMATPVDVASPSIQAGEVLQRAVAGDRKICLYYNIPSSPETTGSLYCAGNNQYGQFGIGTAGGNVTNFTTEFILPSGVNVKEIFMTKGNSIPGRKPTVGETPTNDGRTPICVLGTNGSAYCAGRNELGQLGDGSTTDRSTPVRFVLPLDP